MCSYTALSEAARQHDVYALSVCYRFGLDADSRTLDSHAFYSLRYVVTICYLDGCDLRTECIKIV